MDIFNSKMSEEFDSNFDFDLDTDALKTDSRILYPGRFYVLKYMSETKKEDINGRPVIISFGISKKDPESFLCLDLCVIPLKVRLKFLETYFRMFKNEIEQSVKRYTDVKDAEKQVWMKKLTYQDFFKFKEFEILKPAIKKYKIKNTMNIYALMYNDIYKVVGKFSDEDMFISGSIRNVQNEFIKNVRTIRNI